MHDVTAVEARYLVLKLMYLSVQWAPCAACMHDKTTRLDEQKITAAAGLNGTYGSKWRESYYGDTERASACHGGVDHASSVYTPSMKYANCRSASHLSNSTTNAFALQLRCFGVSEQERHM